MNAEVILPLAIWSFFSLISGFMAFAKNRDPFKWFLMGAVLGPFAIGLLLILRQAPINRGGDLFSNPEIQQMVSKGIYNGWKQGKLNLYKEDTGRSADSMSAQRTLERRNFTKVSIGRPVKTIHASVTKRRPFIF